MTFVSTYVKTGTLGITGLIGKRVPIYFYFWHFDVGLGFPGGVVLSHLVRVFTL